MTFAFQTNVLRNPGTNLIVTLSEVTDDVILRDESGNRSGAQLLAFEDIWHD